MQIFPRQSLALAAVFVCAASAFAANIPVGYISWDVNFPGNAGQFDIVNLTGPNSSTFPDTTFPVTNTLKLSGLSMMVTFKNGTSVTEPSSYFALAPDGESFNGSAIPIGGTNPLPVSATLTGNFLSNSISLNSGGSPQMISTAFSATFSDAPNLVDGDLAVIYAAPMGSTTPEPGTWMLAPLGIACLILARKRRVQSTVRTLLKKKYPAFAVSSLPVFCFLICQSAFGQVNLATVTAPSSGVAGVNNVNITGTQFPTGAITPANVVVTISSTCDGAPVATVAATSVRTVLGSYKRVNFPLPSSLSAGNYFVTIADSVSGDADFTTVAGSCSQVTVTSSSTSLNACLAGSSLGVLLPPAGATGNVTAYVPKGAWNFGTSGIFVQNVEGTIGSSATIPTPNIVNSCSSNPATGQTVCVANNTDVYVVAGTTISNSLTSGSNTRTSFSGGTCNNCGVAINALNNTAVINMGITGGSSNSGVQVLNLNTSPPSFNAPFPMQLEVSENISVDPTRSLILSADEGGNYVLLQIQSDGSLKEFDSITRSTGVSGGESDSSAEDCSTGIAITPNEFTNGVFIEDLTQAVFTPGSPGTYTAPNSTLLLASAYTFSAGLNGIAVAQGSGHLAIVTGEFGGNTFAVLQLPSTGGSGTPTIADYVSAQIPSSSACGGTFSAGFDPHTETAYTSPNNGKSYAIYTGYSGSIPKCLVQIDLGAILVATRGGAGYLAHDVAPANLPPGALTFFPL